MRRARTDREPASSAPRIDRRLLLAGGLAVVGGALAACTASPPSASPSPTRPDPTWTTRPVPRPTPDPLRDPAPYAVLPGEVEPACKQVAVDFVAAVLTTGTVGSTGVPLETKLAAIGQSPAVAAPLLAARPADGSAAVEIVYPQYGGLNGGLDRASVMLVADHLVRPREAFGGMIERRSITVDVRLSRTNGVWTVTEVIPAVLPAAAPSVSPTAAAALANPRLVIPAAARADIVGGGVHDAVLGTLQSLSERWKVHVQVLTAGHPLTIFATNITSNHTRGKAVDIWALDDAPIIGPARDAARDLMLAGLDLGATEVGGPHGLGRSGTFTNATHQDHVHLGFPRAV